MRTILTVLLATLFFMAMGGQVHAGPTTTALRETAEWILKKFGRGVAGDTVEQIAETTARTVAKHGDEALPFLRRSGHAGFRALEEAGEKAPDIIKLYAKRGDEALWIISEPHKLAMFIKHGDTAAEALLKHPGIADNLIGRYGDDAANALSSLSRQNAQRLSMLAEDGMLNQTVRSPELLPIIRRYGDEAMDFIWKHKGSLAVAAVLGKFLADPQLYMRGAKDLIADPLVAPIAKGTNWTLIIGGVLIVAFLPSIVRSVAKARQTLKAK
jgi:hypothetical protein